MGDNNQNNNQETNNNQNNNGTGTGTVTENQNQNPNNNNNNQNAGGLDFAKLDEILEKRMNSVLKSVLKGNGVEDEGDLSGIISAYRNSKTQAQNAQNDRIAELERENNAYKAKERENAINSVVNSTAKTLGIDTEKLAMMKFDTSEAVDKDGKVDAAKMKQALEALVEKAPWLKNENADNNNNQNNNGNNGGFKPGNPGGDGKKDDKTEYNRLRKLAGLKPIE